MKRLILLLVLVASVPVFGATYNYEQITVDNTSGGVGFTASKITPSDGRTVMNIAQCRLETAEIRYRYDSGAPTSSVGTLLEIGEMITLTKREDILNFKAIRTGGSNGSLSCTYKDQ